MNLQFTLDDKNPALSGIFYYNLFVLISIIVLRNKTSMWKTRNIICGIKNLMSSIGFNIKLKIINDIEKFNILLPGT